MSLLFISHPVVSNSAIPWNEARQASLSLTIYWILPKFMCITSMMPSSHLILWYPLLLLYSIFPSISVFSNEAAVCIRWPKYRCLSFCNRKIDAFELWCWRRLLRVPWTAMRSNLSILKEISPEYSLDYSLDAKAPILWPPNAMSRLIRKDTDAGKDWRQEKKGTTENEMVRWHHRLDGHEQAPGAGDGQGSLACCHPWGRKGLDTKATEQQQ